MQPGVPVRPQLALASNSVRWAFNHMHDKEGKLREFVVEMKFDGKGCLGPSGYAHCAKAQRSALP